VKDNLVPDSGSYYGLSLGFGRQNHLINLMFKYFSRIVCKGIIKLVESGKSYIFKNLDDVHDQG